MAGTVHTLPRHELMTFFMGPEASGADLNLSPSFGEPFDMAELFDLEPESRAGFEALSLNYTGIDGSEALRAAIAETMPGLTAEDVVVTCGLDEGIALLHLALVETGSRVVVQTPCYQPLKYLADWRGAQLFDLPAHEDLDWAFDLDDLRERCQRGARLVILNLPHNPTGFMPDEAFIAEVLDIIDKAGGWLVVDEVYSGLPPTDPAPLSFASRHPRCITLNGLSKSFGLPGLRIGWIASRDPEVIGPIRRLRQHLNSFIPAPSEFLGQLALRHRREIHTRNWSIAETSRNHLSVFMETHAAHFSWVPPKAGVNAFPRWLGPGGTKALSDALLRDEGLLLAPSRYFGAGDDHVRIGFGKRDTKTGLDRLSGWLRKTYAVNA